MSSGNWKITKSFVEKLVQEPIVKYTVKTGSNIGDNVAGELLSISVITQSGHSIDLVFKSFPEDPEQLAYIKNNQVFRIETAIYDSIKPSLEQLLLRACQPANLPIPKCYAFFNNDENDYLCLEDLRPAGYKMLDKLNGLGNMETRRVLEEVARFHALTYHLIRYEGQKYFEGEGEVRMLADNLWTRQNEEEIDLSVKLLGGSVAVGLEFIEKDDMELAKKVRAVFRDQVTAGNIVKSTTVKTDVTYFPVVVHGDLWTNNILFKYDQDGKEILDIKFVDFQQARRGNIYEDLQYFLLTSTTPPDRQVYLTTWLEAYYKSFTKTLAEVHCPIPINFTRGFFVDEMWNCFLAGYAYMYFAIPFQLGIFTPLEGEVEETPPTPTEQPPTADMTAAIMHNKFRKWTSRSALAKQRFVDITREFVDYGLL